MVGFSEHNNEPSGCVKWGAVIGQLSDYQLLKDSAACR